MSYDLDLFLEKIAQRPGGAPGGPPAPTPGAAGFAHDLGSGIRSGLVGGASAAIGQGLVGAVMGAFSKGLDTVKDFLIMEPRRKALLEQTLRTDPVLADAVERNPNAKQQVVEAYETMVKVAPTLASDVNVVRSFLREAVLSGAGVNYATVKNLAEAEGQVVRNNQRPQMGGFHGR